MGYFAHETNFHTFHSELKLLTDWLRANKLVLNELKTKFLLVGRISKLDLTLSNIKLNEHSLPPCKFCPVPFALRLTKRYLWRTKLKFF